MSYYGLVVEGGGVFRNNALEGCAAARESTADADPSVFEANALNGGYLDEGAALSDQIGTETRLLADAVNALTDMTTSRNLDASCQFIFDGHLAAGSPCIDAGTSSGAPADDMDGNPRSNQPDIGPDEYVP